MPKNKSTGLDDVAIKPKQAMGNLGVEWLTTIANKIYDEGQFSLDMRRSASIVLPKSPGTGKCELHRTISLMSHTTKLILKVLLCRMRGQHTHLFSILEGIEINGRDLELIKTRTGSKKQICKMGIMQVIGLTLRKVLGKAVCYHHNVPHCTLNIMNSINTWKVLKYEESI